MKSLRKIMALLIAMVMVLGMSVSVFAAPVDKNLTVPSEDGHIYEIFQIFVGDLAEKDEQKVLSNIQWGANSGKTGLVDKTTLTKLANLTATADAAKVDEILSDLGISKDSLTDTSAFKKDVAAGATVSVPSGYYIIKDKDNTQADGAYSLLMIDVVGDATVQAKMDKPEVFKKVTDVNDTTAATEVDRDSADYDIGDAVPYKLTATLATNVSAYKKYHITFVDTLEAGKFSAISELTIKLNGNTIADGEGYTVSTTGYQGDVTPSVNGFTQTIEFIPSGENTFLPESLNGARVTVEFTATLGENAAIGKPGNENKVKLEYSNNPNDDQGGEEGTTPEDKVKVFTYKVDVNKITGNKVALTGANFTLYKEVPAGTTGAQLGSEIKKSYDSSVKATALVDTKSYIEVANKTGDASGSTFEFKGVDDGTYVLVETTIPNGYNAWDAVEFVIDATHVDGDNPKLTELKGGDLFSGDAGTVVLDEGKLETNVVNNSGSTLPSTGGMGTTLFYIVGGILVAGAAIILIAKRKVNA